MAVREVYSYIQALSRAQMGHWGELLYALIAVVRIVFQHVL